MDFNLIDALLVAIVLFSAMAGWRRGFVLASLDLLALAASVIVAFLGYPFVANVIQEIWITGGIWVAPLSFLVTFLLAHLVFGVMAGHGIRAVPRKAHDHGVNRFFGIAPGLVNGLINATVVALVLLTVPLFGGINKMAREGMLSGRLTEPAAWLEAKLSPIFDAAVRRTLQVIIVPPESKATIPLNFKVTQARPRPDLEARMLEMVNAERARLGMKLLKADPDLTEVARDHSRDMLARGYFSHVSPEGKDLGDRLHSAHVRYLAAGENLALAQTLGGAHQGLMDSPGHRANILRPQFGRVGVGVLDAGAYGLMVTQNFRS